MNGDDFQERIQVRLLRVEASVMLVQAQLAVLRAFVETVLKDAYRGDKPLTEFLNEKIAKRAQKNLAALSDFDPALATELANILKASEQDSKPSEE